MRADMARATDSAGRGSGVSGNPGFPPEASPGARRAAWLAILLIGWLFSYSIGWHKGWIVGNRGTDERFDQINQTLNDIRLGSADAGAAAPGDGVDDPPGNV
jgi:hypothetical protein